MKNMQSKIIKIVLCFLIVFTLSACGEKQANSQNVENENSVDDSKESSSFEEILSNRYEAVDYMQCTDETVIEFEDQKLYEDIVGKVGKTEGEDITYGDVKEIKFLDLDTEYTNLEPLKYFEGLEEVSCYINEENKKDIKKIFKEYNRLPQLWTLSCSVEIGEEAKEIFGELTNLSSFRLTRSGEWKNLDFLENVSNLEVLELKDCYSIEDISMIKNMENLNSLEIDDCDMIKILGDVTFSGITRLNFSSSEITNLEFLKAFPELTELSLDLNENVVDISNINELQKLEKIEIKDCASLLNIGQLNNLSMLNTLMIYNCNNFNGFEGSNNLNNLSWLKISCCDSFKDLAGIEKLSNLDTLTIINCEAITLMDSLVYAEGVEFSHLRNLILNDQPCGYEYIGSYFPYLKSIEVEDCFNFGLRGYGVAGEIESISISGCEAFTSIGEIDNYPNLKSLSITGCRNFKVAPSIGRVNSLERLELSFCPNLYFISGIEALPNLKELYISSCDEFFSGETIESVEVYKEMVNAQQ